MELEELRPISIETAKWFYDASSSEMAFMGIVWEDIKHLEPKEILNRVIDKKREYYELVKRKAKWIAKIFVAVLALIGLSSFILSISSQGLGMVSILNTIAVIFISMLISNGILGLLLLFFQDTYILDVLRHISYNAIILCAITGIIFMLFYIVIMEMK